MGQWFSDLVRKDVSRKIRHLEFLTLSFSYPKGDASGLKSNRKLGALARIKKLSKKRAITSRTRTSW